MRSQSSCTRLFKNLKNDFKKIILNFKSYKGLNEFEFSNGLNFFRYSWFGKIRFEVFNDNIERKIVFDQIILNKSAKMMQ